MYGLNDYGSGLGNGLQKLSAFKDSMVGKGLSGIKGHYKDKIELSKKLLKDRKKYKGYEGQMQGHLDELDKAKKGVKRSKVHKKEVKRFETLKGVHGEASKQKALHLAKKWRGEAAAGAGAIGAGAYGLSD